MRKNNTTRLLLALALLAPATADAQQVTEVAGARYDRSAATEFWLGRNWRSVWVTPVVVPVLDLATFGGGLTPVETGGRQSKTLHFRGGDGRRYIFRSVDKWLHKEALPPDVRDTPIGELVQDQISTLFPAPGLIVSPIHDAVGVLYSRSTYVVLPDDARLGEFRDTYAGMLGQIEENPDEGEDDTPGFAGSRKVHSTENFYEAIDESPKSRLASDEFLKARLLDFLIGDTDRGGDQWKFARFPQGDGFIYRPIPRDRDFAFMGTDGVLSNISRRVYAKLLDYDESYEPMRTLTFMTTDMDRRLLVELPRAQWDSVVNDVKTKLTDDVLRAAVGRMPPEYQRLAASYLLQSLIARRDQLDVPAGQLYAMVSRYADVHATAEAERAEIERLDDGSLDVRLYAGAAAGIIAARGTAQPAPGDARATPVPYFQRRFVPGETREVRVYMHGGDDRVRVSGEGSDRIIVRVIGGAGDDVLEDVSTGGVVFYTAAGSDRVTAGMNTRVDARPYNDPLPGRPEDMKRMAAEAEAAEEAGDSVAVADVENQQVGQKLAGSTDRDWGARSGFGPAVDHRSRIGILVGVKHQRTLYGFRRSPHATQLSLGVLYSLETRGFGAELDVDHRFENSPIGLTLEAHATQFESFRFFGFGNDTPEFDGNTRARRDEVAVRPGIAWRRPQAQLLLGPVVRYGRTHFDDESPMALARPIGSTAFGQAGAWADARFEAGATQQPMPRGFILEAGGSAYPALLDVPSTYGEAHALARAYVGVPALRSSFLALRAGGQKLIGEFPVHDAAFLGGRHTLRGYTTDRFAGDAMLFGGAELHTRITEMTLLVRGRLGAFVLADAGRVYFEGASPGSWHTALGGGLTFETLGQVVSLTYAKGERARFYIELGLPF